MSDEENHHRGHFPTKTFYSVSAQPTLLCVLTGGEVKRSSGLSGREAAVEQLFELGSGNQQSLTNTCG